MATRRAAALLLAVALATAGCLTVLKDEERAWCTTHLREVVTASFTIGSPLSAEEASRQAESEEPSPAYERACRSAYTQDENG